MWVFVPLQRSLPGTNTNTDQNLPTYRFHGWWRRTSGSRERRCPRQPQWAPSGASSACVRVRIRRVLSRLCSCAWWAGWLHCLPRRSACRQCSQALTITNGSCERHGACARSQASRFWVRAALCARRSIGAAATAAGAAATAQTSINWCSRWWACLCLWRCNCANCSSSYARMQRWGQAPRPARGRCPFVGSGTGDTRQHN